MKSRGYPASVHMAMNHATSTFNRFLAADWHDMALACLDQAGFSAADQKRFQAAFPRPDEGVR